MSDDAISIYKVDNGALILSCKSGTKSSEINQYFFDKGIVLNGLDTFQETLENQFLEIVK